MTEIVIRNPRARWLTSLIVGVVYALLQTLLALNGITQCTADRATCATFAERRWLLLSGPIVLITLLDVWHSTRAKVTLSDKGIAVRRLLYTQILAWSDITQVNKVDKMATGDSGVIRSHMVQIVLADGTTEDLPAPSGTRLFGRRTFETRADTIFREWWLRAAPPKPQPYSASMAGDLHGVEGENLRPDKSFAVVDEDPPRP